MEKVGYVDFDGKIAKLQEATCKFENGQLDVEASGKNVKVHLYGIPFENVETIADLNGKSFGPTDEGISGDPFAEGGIELRDYWLSFQNMECKCRSYDPSTNLITVWFCADVEDYESGRSGSVDCSMRCTISQDRPSKQQPKKALKTTATCPSCKKLLRSNLAKQCFECGANWH